jgi:quinoprotein glucose dehydrogenase
MDKGGQMNDVNAPRSALLLRAYALLIALIGLYLVIYGGELLRLGGSPYYLVAGLALIASGALLMLRKRSGASLYGAVVFATLVWALWEVGWNGWALMPRIVTLAVLGLILFVPRVSQALRDSRPPHWWTVLGGTVAAALLGTAAHALLPPLVYPDPLYQAGIGPAPAASPVGPDDGQWLNYGKDAGGSRFSALGQITPANVDRLTLAWNTDLGSEGNDRYGDLEVTPLMAGDQLFLCKGNSDVIALDPDTGNQLWHYDAELHMTPNHCRGVAYYAPLGRVGACAARVLSATVDARLIALDAATGKPCADFGSNGTVDLKEGLGTFVPGIYRISSAPTLFGNVVVVNGNVADGQYMGEPSGVIRGYDAATGKLVWAWDVGRPDRTDAPGLGETYTPGTPNSWAPLSVDEELGLVYVPLGNPTPDYYGVMRRQFDERFGSALVALDAATGHLRWSFQTVHHDLWDYDIASQPSVVDFPKDGKIVHAVVQPTKRGEIFILDRKTGEPIYPVVERPAPQDGKASEERLALTQPYSPGVPSLRGARLTERQTWGITPLDQLWCRIRFRQARYDGDFTPPGLEPSIQYPGYAGGSNWGSAAIDKSRHIALFNVNLMPVYPRLVPRAEADRMGLHIFDPKRDAIPDEGLNSVQAGTPYAISTGVWLSPIAVPCHQPPYGLLAAVDLTTGKLIWSRPFGTASESGPKFTPSHLPLTMGVPNVGGGFTTVSGLFFIGASQDRYLRAFETATGRELWRATLPGGGNASPMTYLSPKSGRQFVVITAGGSLAASSKASNRIVAYALPREIRN